MFSLAHCLHHILHTNGKKYLSFVAALLLTLLSMNKTSKNPRLTSKFQNKTHKKHQFIYQIAAIAHWIHTSLWHKLCCFVAFIHRRAYKHCKKCQNIPRGSFQNISNIYMKNRMKLTLFSTKIFYINRYLCIKSFKISINSVVAIFKSQKCIYSQKSMQCSLFYIQFTVVQKKSCLNESQKGCQTLTACTELRVYDALCAILYYTNTTIGYIYLQQHWHWCVLVHYTECILHT